MVGVSRNRSRTIGDIVVGSMTPVTPPGPVSFANATDWNKKIESCDDVVGNFYGFNSFKSHKVTRKQLCFSGPQMSGGTVVRTFDNWPAALNPSQPYYWSTYSDLTVLDKSNLAWEAMGKTNPSVPPLNALQMIGELKDLPSLIRDWGGSLIRKVAKGHLTYRFAVRPMVSDILSLCKFQETVERRLNEIKKLQSGKTIRKRCSLRNNSTSWPNTNVLMQSQWVAISGTQHTTITEKVWATVHWKMSSSNMWLPKMKSGADLRKLARRTVLGINSYGALKAAWELLPWSWFLDWFWNIGRLIDATNNQLGLTSTNICVMRERSSRLTYSIGTLPPNIFLTNIPRYETITKERHLVVPLVPLVPVTLNVLTGKQWSILADLVVLRTSKGT